jgi:hypothetical protein
MKLTFLIIATMSLLLALFVESMEHVSPSTSVSLQSLLTSAILLAVPITHLLARRSLTHAGYLLFQPFKGGSKFVTLQALAWTLWTLAFCSAGFSFVLVAMKQTGPTVSTDGGMEVVDLPSSSLSIPWRWLSNLITSAGVGGILSQALVLLSLKYFDSKLSRKIGTTARVIEMVRSEQVMTPHTLGVPDTLEKDVFDRAVQVLSSPAAMQRQMWPPHPSPPRNLATSSVSPIAIPKPSTAAKLRLHETVDQDVDDAPTLMLPLKGAAAVEPVERLDVESPESPISPEPPLTLARVKFSDLSQSLHLALHYYRSFKWMVLLKETALDARSLLVISILYMIPIIGAIGTFIPMVLIYTLYPLPWYFYTLYGTFILLYISTYRGRPSLTGARSWTAVRNNDVLWSSMERYFNGQVVALGSLSEAQGPYIFGFHPHGVYPMTCFWATRGTQFQKSYPGLNIDVCGASIMFHAPLLREIVMWAGGREVSGTAIRMALKQKRSVMLVPGGQREMRHSQADPR